MQTRAGAGNVAGSGHLERPPGSKVTTEELLREVEEYFAVGAQVTPGAIVLDVGSNIGAFSLRVSERCAGDVRLLCFEPSPATVGALRSNFATHPTLRHTRHSIHHVGLTSKENAQRELAFYDFRRFPTNSTFDLGGKRREFEIFFEDRGRRIGALFRNLLPAGARLLERLISWAPKGKLGWWVLCQVMGLVEYKVRCVTLEEVVRSEQLPRIDLLKIDVEGAEIEVLRGLGADAFALVQQIVLETHNRDGRLRTIEELLRRHGLSEIRVAVQHAVDNGLESIILLAARPERRGEPAPAAGPTAAPRR